MYRKCFWMHGLSPFPKFVCMCKCFYESERGFLCDAGEMWTGERISGEGGGILGKEHHGLSYTATDQ